MPTQFPSVISSRSVWVRRRQSILVATGLVLATLASAPPALAQLNTTVHVSGLVQPVGFVQDPSDPTLQYVVQQGGRIRVVQQGLLLPVDFLDLSGAISTGGERGLLGLAFPPNAATSGRCYVNFTNAAGHTVIARFTRSTTNPLVADPASRFDLRWPSGERFIRQPFGNHNGGKILFGPDGTLYIGMGDGGSASDPGHRAQDPNTLLGKLLRIDVDVPDAVPTGYRVPPDNPFVDGLPIPALGEIWAFGLRNPWRITIDDPAHGGTGALLIADVGQNAWEEINYEPAASGGRNYGWRNREGRHDHVTALPPAFGPLTDPIHEYDRGFGRSITGGSVYRGSALGGQWVGRYFYADFESGRVASLGLAIDPGTGEASVLDQLEHTAELGGTSALGNVSSIDVDAAGELYIVNYSAGRILRIGTATIDGDGDELPDDWEVQFGLDPLLASGDDGAAGDPDGDGQSNLTELMLNSHPRGFERRFFAEGATGAFFQTQFALVNPGGTVARVLYRFLKSDGTRASRFVLLNGLTRHTLDAGIVSGLQSAEFSTILESDLPIVTDRVMHWIPGDTYGSHGERGITSTATTWYFAEGSTHGFQLFYLIQNPTSSVLNLEIAFLRPAGASPIVKTYAVAPESRFNIWINLQDPALARTDVAAVLRSLNGVPFIAERAMYVDLPGQPFGAGHESAGITSPSTTWLFAEGATGPFFDLFLLLANPGATPARVQATFLLPDGSTVSRTYTLAPLSRQNVWVDFEDPRLADSAVSISLRAIDDVPFLAERAMWWSGDPTPAGWYEAHAAPGAPTTGRRWALAAGDLTGTPARASTYVLIANTSPTPGDARVTLLFEDGSTVDRMFALPALSRLDIDVAFEFPEAITRRFGALIESQGPTPPALVVEWSRYRDRVTATGTQVWAAGANAAATRLE